jgi:hypothetical protein
VKKETPKPGGKAFVCMFCSRAGHLNEFCFWYKRIEKSYLDYARNSYVMSSLIFYLILILMFHLDLILILCLAVTLVLCLRSLMDLTIAHMVLVHERTALCLDALDMTHILIVVILSYIGLVFLQEGFTPILCQDTWMVHILLVVVLVPLIQMVMCKRL